jgi:hypothetical protein
MGGGSGFQHFSKQLQIEGDSGVIAEVNPLGQLHTVMSSLVSVLSSSSTPLGVDGVFTGESQNILDYAVIGVAVFSDKASATDGLSVEFSADGIAWDHCDVYTIPANTGKTFSFQPVAQYFRVVYTNGDAEQTIFRLQTILHKTYVKPSSHRIKDSIIGDDDAELSKSVISGENPSGDFINFEATAKGNFKCSIEEFENLVSINNNEQLKTSLLDSAGRVLEFDNLFKAVLVIQTEHHEIHEGNHYSICDSDVFSISDEIEFVITTPDTAEWAHMLFRANSTAGFTLEIFEGTNTVVGGTPVTPTNNNRNSVNTSSLTVLQDPTSLVTGSSILKFGGGNNQRSGIVNRGDELILKRNETYLFRIISLNNNNTISYCGDWYEHTGE